MNPDDALKKLLLGNSRYVKSQQEHPHQSPQHREKLAREGQRPFAVILTCSDSRVPPEVIFDQGLGDLFVIRVAGNVIDDIVLGSIEYAVEHLGTPLILVMGHSNCGAVSAGASGQELTGYLKFIGESIQPAVDKARHLSGDLVDNAIRAHVSLSIEKLKTSGSILPMRIDSGSLKIVAAYYHLETGIVEIFPAI